MTPRQENHELAVHWSGLTDPHAPTLVLLHGLADSGRCWPDAVARWQGDYRIAGVDALGHGRSPRYTSEELTGDPIALMYGATRRVVAQISGDGANPPVLVGHSMGGGIAGALAAWAPGLVRAAVLEDPAWISHVSWADRMQAAKERVADCQAFRDDFEAALAAGRAENPHWPDAEMAPWAQAKANGDLGFFATGAGFLRTPWTQIAEAVSVPALVVTGTGDVLIDEETRRTLAEMGNAQLSVHVVEGAGHCVRRDQPEAYHALVDPWLAARFA